MQANFHVIVQATLPSTLHVASSRLSHGPKASEGDHWWLSVQRDESLVDLGLGDANVATQEWVEQWSMSLSSLEDILDLVIVTSLY